MKMIILKSINKFVLPLVANNFSNILISSVISAIVGRISMDAIASAEVVDTIIYSLLGILGAGTVCFNIYASQIRNSHPEEFKDFFKSILLLNMTVGCVFVILFMVFSPAFLQFVFGFKGSTLETGIYYARILSFQVLFTMLIFALSNQMKIKKETKKIMITGMISGITNLILTYLLVFVLLPDNLKIVGVGFSSVFASFIQLACFAFILRDDIRDILKIKSSKIYFLIKKSLPLLGQEILEGSIFMTGVTALLSNLGISIFSTYAICMKMTTICIAPMYMYCNAIVIFTGEAYGKKDKEELRILPMLSLACIFSFYFVMSFIFIIKSKFFLSLFTDNELIIKQGTSVLLIILFLSSFQILFEVSKYSLQSLEEEVTVLKMTGASNGIFFLILLLLQYFESISLYTILVMLSVNYLVLFILFYNKYLRKVRQINYYTL